MAKVLIAGLGKLGFHLAAKLAHAGYQVTAMDPDPAACKFAAEKLDALVVQDDATEIEALGEAGAGGADYIVAATGRDEDNLAVCRIAKEKYRCPKVVARVINPRNEALYRISGADAIIDPTTMAADRIRDKLPPEGMRLLSVFESGELSMAELDVPEGAPAVGRRVVELPLPADCVLIALVRSGKVLIARGGTVLSSGDKVYALAKPESMGALRTALIGRAA